MGARQVALGSVRTVHEVGKLTLLAALITVRSFFGSPVS